MSMIDPKGSGQELEAMAIIRAHRAQNRAAGNFCDSRSTSTDYCNQGPANQSYKAAHQGIVGKP